MRRFGVERCDEGGTLFDNEGNLIEHTWSVVDRSRRDEYGRAQEVSNHDTRKSARHEAANRNGETACGCIHAPTRMTR